MRLALALALAGVLVTATGASARGTARAVPPGITPETAAAVGTHDLWVLGGRVLLRSTDGGRHFHRIAAPALNDAVTEPALVFANRSDGFAYVWDSGPLYVTHDGGTSWHRARQRGPVDALAVGGGRVYAVFGRSRFERASVSSGIWHSLPSPVKQGLPLSLAARGRDFWLLGIPKQRRADDSDELVRSTDGGRTFSAGPGPCFSELGGTLESAGNGIVWAVCPTGNFSQTHRSTNGGRSFRIVRTPGQTNGARVAAFSERGALLDRGVNGPLYRTVDGGVRWKAVRGMTRNDEVVWMAFPTGSVGLAVVQPTARRTQVWRTTDRGATWHSIAIR
jgi:photosystem II stability/assembly factor-like uncharacterized protein